MPSFYLCPSDGSQTPSVLPRHRQAPGGDPRSPQSGADGAGERPDQRRQRQEAPPQR